MLRRVCIIIAEIVAVGILLFGAALFVVSAYVDTDDFRATLVKAMEDATGREVQLKGDIGIDVWPEIVLEIHDLSLAEDPEYGSGVFASLDSVGVDVAMLPLFSKVLEIESIVVYGLDLTLIHNGEGRFNWQSLVEKELDAETGKGDFGAWQLVLRDVELRDAQILFRDKPSESDFLLEGLYVRTGEMGDERDIPFTIRSVFLWDEQGIQSDIALRGVAVIGEDDEGVEFKQTSVSASVEFANLPEAIRRGDFTSDVRIDLKKQTIAFEKFEALAFGLRARGSVETGELSKAFSAKGNLDILKFAPAPLLNSFAPTLPLANVDGLKSAELSTRFSVTDTDFKADDLRIEVDDLMVKGDVSVAGFSDPQIQFNLVTNTVDLDRYLPLFATGMPFIWDDFHLPLFRAFSGSGTIHAEALKIKGSQIDTINLDLSGVDETIRVSASGQVPGFSEVKAELESALGQSESGDPTMSLALRAEAVSTEAGFPFLSRDDLQVTGAGTLELAARVDTITCPPQQRSLDLLKHLGLKIVLGVGKGEVILPSREEALPLTLDYKQLNLDVAIESELTSDYTQWKLGELGFTLRSRGGSDVETLSLTGKGPLFVGLERFEIESSGIALDGYGVSSLLPSEAKRVHAKGVVAFNTDNDSVEVSDALLTALEASASGTAFVSNLKTTPKVTGTLSLEKVDPKRIIFLLTGKSIRTRDNEALRAVVFDTNYMANVDGFSLSGLKGSVDGMPLRARVVAQGYTDPSFAVSLSAGFLDIDRYLPPKKPVDKSENAPKANPVDLPLKFLRWLNVNGRATFQAFRLSKIRANTLRAEIKAHKGDIHVADAKADFYGGHLTADWTGKVGKESLTTHLVLGADNFLSGALVADLAGREYIKGKSDVDINLKSEGATDDDILKNLNGTVATRTTNGSFKFIGYETRTEEDKGRNKVADEKAKKRAEARTFFEKGKSNFVVKNGVFTVKSMTVSAPVLKSSGKGYFSLPDDAIDMEIRNDFVGVPSVTVELTGKLSDPRVKVPTGKILNDTVFNILSLPQKSLIFMRDLLVP